MFKVNGHSALFGAKVRKLIEITKFSFKKEEKISYSEKKRQIVCK